MSQARGAQARVGLERCAIRAPPGCASRWGPQACAAHLNMQGCAVRESRIRAHRVVGPTTAPTARPRAPWHLARCFR